MEKARRPRITYTRRIPIAIRRGRRDNSLYGPVSGGIPGSPSTCARVEPGEREDARLEIRPSNWLPPTGPVAYNRRMKKKRGEKSAAPAPLPPPPPDQTLRKEGRPRPRARRYWPARATRSPLPSRRSASSIYRALRRRGCPDKGERTEDWGRLTFAERSPGRSRSHSPMGRRQSRIALDESIDGKCLGTPREKCDSQPLSAPKRAPGGT